MQTAAYPIPSYPQVVCTHCGKRMRADQISSHRC